MKEDQVVKELVVKEVSVKEVSVKEVSVKEVSVKEVSLKALKVSPEKKPSQEPLSPDSSQTPPTHRTLPPPTTPVHSRYSAIAAATTPSLHPSR